MSQKEVFNDIRKDLGYQGTDKEIDKLTQGTFFRLQYQFKDLIREFCRALKINMGERK